MVAPQPPSMPPIDPGGGEACGVGGHVIVEQALRGVQDILPLDAEFRDVLQQIGEVAWVRLVGTDILGGVDRIERHAEPAVAGGETVAVDIGKNHQLVMRL